jgi:hypothetical protein
MHVEKIISGRTYRFEKLGYRKARAVLVLVAKVAAPALSELDGLSLRGLAGADLGKLGGALGAALERLEDTDLETVTQAFAERCSVRQGEAWAPLSDEAKREVHFDAVGLGGYFAWLRHAFEVSFGDFFAELRAAAKSRPGGGEPAR